MTKNAKVTSPARATSATQTRLSADPAFGIGRNEGQARLDLQQQPTKDLQDQKQGYGCEVDRCKGTYFLITLLFCAIVIYLFRQAPPPERCASALEAQAVQMKATPTTITVTLPIATNAAPSIEAAPAIKAASSTEAAQSTQPFWTTLTHEQIRSVVHDFDKIQDRYRDNHKAWQQEQDAKRKANMQQMIAQWAKNMAEKRRREEEAQVKASREQ